MRKTYFDVKFRDEVLAEQLKSELMYYFWSKSECEIILTSWPPYLTSAQVEELKALKFDGMTLDEVVAGKYVL